MKREAAANPTMLGEKQRDWLADSVTNSKATWKIWASALMLSQMVVDLKKYAAIPPGFQHAFFLKTDSWDGFLLRLTLAPLKLR